MSILNRKMFQQGDEVTPFLNQLRGPQYEEYELDIKLEDDGAGNFFEVKRDPQGKIVSTKPINLNLSPTQDPLEAYRTQSYNERIQALKNVGKGIVGALTTKGVGGFLGRQLGPLVPNVLKSRFSPVQVTKKPGQVMPGKKGFQPQDPTKISSYNIKPKPGVIPGSLFVGGYGGLSAAQVTESDIQKEIEQLEKQKKPETQEIEKQDKQAIDPLFGGISNEEVDKVLGVSEENVDQEIQNSEQNQQALIDSFKDFQDAFIDDKNLARLLRNTGVKLVEEGRFSGIASGAAAAAKERAAEEVLESEREAEQRLQEMKSGGVDISDLKSISGLEQEYLDNYQASQDNKNTAKQVQDVVNVLKTQGQNVFGVGNIISSNLKQIMKFVAGDPNLASKAKDIEKNLKTENPRLYIKTILEIVQNREIKELLGESGRTISNLDRQVVERIVGQLKDTSIFGQDPLTIAAKLELLVEDQIKQQRANEEKAIAVARNLVLAGRDPSQLISAPQEKAEKRVRITI